MNHLELAAAAETAQCICSRCLDQRQRAELREDIKRDLVRRRGTRGQRRMKLANRTSTPQQWADATHFMGGPDQTTLFHIVRRSPCPRCGQTNLVIGNAALPNERMLVAGRYIPCGCPVA